MSRALLDVNVLLALFDSDHIDHERAAAWLDAEIVTGWASCTVTQNGFVRIISQSRYPSPVSPNTAATLLRAATATPHHEFWSCNFSILDDRCVDTSRLHGPRQVTDAYLLALAVAHHGRLVSFDRSLPLTAVTGATRNHVEVL